VGRKDAATVDYDQCEFSRYLDALRLFPRACEMTGPKLSGSDLLLLCKPNGVFGLSGVRVRFSFDEAAKWV